ncbi:unnamed protein product [Diplocarpon coronariae]
MAGRTLWWEIQTTSSKREPPAASASSPQSRKWPHMVERVAVTVPKSAQEAARVSTAHDRHECCQRAIQESYSHQHQHRYLAPEHQRKLKLKLFLPSPCPHSSLVPVATGESTEINPTPNAIPTSRSPYHPLLQSRQIGHTQRKPGRIACVTDAAVRSSHRSKTTIPLRVSGDDLKEKSEGKDEANREMQKLPRGRRAHVNSSP